MGKERDAPAAQPLSYTVAEAAKQRAIQLAHPYKANRDGASGEQPRPLEGHSMHQEVLPVATLKVVVGGAGLGTAAAEVTPCNGVAGAAAVKEPVVAAALLPTSFRQAQVRTLGTCCERCNRQLVMRPAPFLRTFRAHLALIPRLASHAAPQLSLNAIPEVEHEDELHTAEADWAHGHVLQPAMLSSPHAGRAAGMESGQGVMADPLEDADEFFLEHDGVLDSDSSGEGEF